MATLRLICNQCGKRLRLDAVRERVCGECGGSLRAMGHLEGLIDRWFALPDQQVSELHRRHTQMIELMWTAGGRAQDIYRALEPRGVSYSGFISRITKLVCRGIEEGWVEVQIPRVPVADDAAYRLVFLDPDRFADEVSKLFPSRSP